MSATRYVCYTSWRISARCICQNLVHLADVSCTWKKPDGPPFTRKTIDKPGSRVIGVVLVVEKEGMKDYYFLKLSGPDELVKSQAGALRKALGADEKLEKPFDLNAAENK